MTQKINQDRDIGSFLERTFSGHSSHLACIDGASGETLTYRQAGGRVGNIAAALQKLGVANGEVVLLQASTSLPALLCCWAVWMLGATPVPVDPTWPPYLISAVLARLTPRLILHSGEQDLANGLPSFHISDPEGRATEGFRHWLEGERKPGYRTVVEDRDRHRGVILFTSGSTGLPKGVVLSQGSLLRSADLVTSTFRWQPTDRFLNLAELHSMSGLRNTCLAAAACGAAVLLVPSRRRSDPFTLAQTLHQVRPTLLGVGPMTIRTALQFRDRLESPGWTGLRQVICTGGYLAPQDACGFTAWTGAPLINYYGLTETTGICIAHTVASALDCDGTLGWPVGSCCRIVDDAGRDVPEGCEGELVVTGPNLMLGYLGQPELTAEVLQDGCFHTGDWARIHPDGRVVLVGRIRHCIKTSHTDLLFPEEIEAALAGHRAILDAAAVCIPSRENPDCFLALLVPRPGVATGSELTHEVHQFLKSRLGPRRLPREYRFVDRIPRFENGKINRAALLENPPDEA